MIVALLNQQDAVGKTTLALHLAGVWTCHGHRVVVIDADPDGYALEWSELRAREALAREFIVAALARHTLHRELPSLARDADRVIVDGPSHIEAITRSALLAADIALVPAPPPPFQGSPFAETLQLANQMMIVRPQLRIRLVLNRCSVHANVTRDIAQTLADYDPPELTSAIAERAVLAQAMESDRLVFELPHSTAAVHEIAALADEVERIAS